MHLYVFLILLKFSNPFPSSFSSMGKKRNAMMIDMDVDNDKVNEILRRKKKRSSKIKLSKKTPGESSAQSRGTENPLTNPVMINHDDAHPMHLALHVTPAYDGAAAHD